jgi:hypothetical protein
VNQRQGKGKPGETQKKRKTRRNFSTRRRRKGKREVGGKPGEPPTMLVSANLGGKFRKKIRIVKIVKNGRAF